MHMMGGKMGGKGGGCGAMMSMMMGMMQGCEGGGWGGGWDHGTSKYQKTESGCRDPPGSGRVFVRGFDFGTTDDQLLAHMSAVGEIVDLQWTTQGSAAIVFKNKASANRAVQELNHSIISGNTRYIDVILKDSE